MKTAKRLLCLLLAIVCCVSLALTGCKKSAKPADSTAPSASATEPTQAPTQPTQPTQQEVVPADHIHMYGDWQTDGTNHWKTCQCGQKDALGGHIDENADEKCDACGYAMPLTAAPLATADQAKNLTAVKTASAGGAVTAHPGGRITYKIAITNKGADAVSVNVTDTLPQGTAFVSGCENVNGNALSWSIKRIEPGKTVTLSYTVKPDYTVQQVRDAKTDIILKNTEAKVMDLAVAAPAKDIWVLETFNATDIRRMEMAIDAMVTANLTAKNSSNKPFCEVNLLTMMYYVGFTSGTNFGTTELDKILTMIYDNAGENTGSGSAGGVEDVVETAQNLLDRVVPTLYGGTKVPGDKDKLFRGSRAAEVTIADLISGDVIVVNTGDDYKLYIVDGQHLVHLGKTQVTRQMDPATVLPGLTSADRYVVIRPSINMNVNLSLNEGEYFNKADEEGYTELEKALIATAETYLLRGDRAQYTDDNTGKNMYRWESSVRQPEDYTVDQYGYTNCAAFTYDVHWATYGVAPKAMNANDNSVSLNTTYNLASSASRGWNPKTLTGSNKTTIFYYNPASKITDAEKAEKTALICSLLRPGDIVCIRRTTGSGHAMLYVGNGLLIHSSGSNYSNNNKTDTHEATIRFRAMMDLFDESIAGKTSYIFNLESFSIVRPQNNYKAKATQNTVNRVNDMEGIIAEKISSTAMGKTVNPGDSITYTFYVFNTTDKAKQVTVKDEISQFAAFQSATDGGVNNGNQISWNITVPADTRMSVSYTVKVNADAATYSKLDGAKATVNGVVHKCYDTAVANTLTVEQQQKLVEAVETVSKMDVQNLTSVQVANLIYKTAFGVDNIFGENVTTYADLLNGSGKDNVGVFNDASGYSDKTIMVLTDANISNAAKMVAPGLYGGHGVYSSNVGGETYFRYLNLADRTLRSRYYWEKDLVVGDLYLLHGTSQESLYLYVGNNRFVILSPGNNQFATTSVSERFEYSPATAWKHHAVLRPSIVLDI